MMKNLSLIISAIFNYYTWVVIALTVEIFKTGLTFAQIKLIMPITIIFDLIAPMLIYVILIKIGVISNPSLIKRKDRPLLFGASSLSILIATVLAFFLAGDLFFKLHLLFFILAFTMFLVTLFFKISGHLLVNTAFIIILNFLFGWNLLWLFLIVPLVGFARLYLKAHTLAEVLAGTAVGFFEPLLVLWVFGLL